MFGHGTIIAGLDVLKTTLSAKTKAIVAQIGDAVNKVVEQDNVVWWQHVGFASRPPRPEAGRRAAQVIVAKAGDHDHAIASRDLRGLDLYGTLADGETCLYGAGEDGTAQGRVLIKKNGNVVIFTAKGNTSDGTGVTIQCNSDGTINIGSEFGGIQLNSSKLTLLHANGAGVECSSSGVTFIGQSIGINSGNVSLGAGLPTGVATLASLGPLLAASLLALTIMDQIVESASGLSETTHKIPWRSASAGLKVFLSTLPLNFSLSVSAS